MASTIGGLNILTKTPTDIKRTTVTYVTDLDLVPNIYEGLRMFVTDVSLYYKYINGKWEVDDNQSSGTTVNIANVYGNGYGTYYQTDNSNTILLKRLIQGSNILMSDDNQGHITINAVTNSGATAPTNGFLYWDLINRKYVPYSDVSLADSNNGLSRISYSDAFDGKMVSATGATDKNFLRSNDNILTPFLRVGNSIIIGTDKTNLSDPENFPGSIHVISGNDNIAGAIDPSFLGMYLYTTNDRCSTPFEIKLDSESMLSQFYYGGEYRMRIGDNTILYKGNELYGIKHLGDVDYSTVPLDGQVIAFNAEKNKFVFITITGSTGGGGTITGYTNGYGINIANNVISIATIGNAGTYTKVTTDSTGRVTSGSIPTTLSGYSITDAAPISHVGSSGNQHALATQSIAGFMSPTDKTKLDNIATGGVDLSFYQQKNPQVAITNGSTVIVTTDTGTTGFRFGTFSLNAPLGGNDYINFKAIKSSVAQDLTIAYGNSKYLSVRKNTYGDTTSNFVTFRAYNNEYEVQNLGTISSGSITLNASLYKGFYGTISSGSITLSITNINVGEVISLDVNITSGTLSLPSGWQLDSYSYSTYGSTLPTGNYCLTFKYLSSTMKKINITTYSTI